MIWSRGQGCCDVDPEAACSSPQGACLLAADSGSLSSHSSTQALYSNNINTHWHIRSSIRIFLESLELLNSFTGFHLEKLLS